MFAARIAARRRFATVIALALVPTFIGCDRPSPPADPNAADDGVAVTDDDAPVADLPRVEYDFPPALRAAHPDIAPFVQAVLDAVIRGDYPAYRKYVARSRTPESPERFERIRTALRRVRVTRIEPLALPDVPQPAYRVLTAFELDPTSKVAIQVEPRELALLVFREAGDWHMLPAPPAYQPRREPATQPTTAPSDDPNLPDYPWDKGVDY